MALSRGLVYCTEPFRIPFAGKLDVLCFDKTGTLTKDKMILKGICAAQNLDLAKDLRIAEVFDGKGESITEMIEPTSAPTIVLTLMGCCHDLVFTDENNLEGYSCILSLFSTLNDIFL